MNQNNQSNISSQEPNIYDFAHTEYAQDAFVAWMCSNFHSKNQQKCSVAKKFLTELLGIKVPFSKVEASTQVKKIDVLLTLDDGKYFVIIEDKKFSNYHSDQLCKYIDELTDQGVKRNQIFVVYYKTGHLARTPNFIYSTSKDGFKYDNDIKSEYDKVSEISSVRNGLCGVKVCELSNIHAFFQEVADEIEVSGSEVLQNYASNIQRQYTEYNSDYIPSRSCPNGASWGKMFDGFIKRAITNYPQLAFKLDLYSGHYWEIYIVSSSDCIDKGEKSFGAPILNIRGDFFSTNPPKIYFFNSNTRFKKKTKNIRINKKSVTCELSLDEFCKKNNINISGDKVHVSACNILFEAVCGEFIKFLTNYSEVPFNCKL